MFGYLDDIEGTEPINRAFLASAPTGAGLGAIVASLEPDRLSGVDRVHLLRAQQRMVSFFQAEMLQTMASIADALDDGDLESYAFAASEIRVGLRLTRRSADIELSFALDLVRRLPQVLCALHDGSIDLARARVIARGTEHLPAAIAGRVADAVIGEAPGMTTGQLRSHLRERCAEVDAADAHRRYEDARARRSIVIEPTTDGTAHLHAYDLAPDDARAIATRLHRHALDSTGDDTGRTMDQRRSDALVDLCRSTHGGSRPGRRPEGSIDLVVDVRTLAGLSDRPGHLAGFGPVVAEVARKVAIDHLDGRWTYTITDGDAVRSTGPLRRRPTASLRRLVEARNRTCVFPGCRMPATSCDLDHRVEHRDGGPTTEDNLSPLCRHDHRLKSTGRWRYEPVGDDHVWTSPLGVRSTTSGRPP